MQLTGLGLIASLPAFLHLGIGRFLKEEWAQALVLIGWASFAAFAIASPGNLYTPLIGFAVLPIVAAMTFGGVQRVLEATVLTALIVLAIAIAGQNGLLPRNSGILATAPVLELAGLVLSLIVVGVALAAILPQMDSQARLRDALFRKSPHNDFCISADRRILCASDQGRSWRKAKTLGDLVQNKQGLAEATQALQQALVDGVDGSLRVPVGPDAKQHLLHVRRLDHYRAIVSLRDVSEEVAREQKLVHDREAALAASRDKTMFLASMSHELRTPLNAIIGFSDMMKARLFGPIPAKYAEYADLIHESGRHLVDLVGDVLDMSKIESAHYTLTRENFDLSEVVRTCVKLMQMGAEDAGVKLIVDLPETEVPVIADRKAVRQILFNLLSNAIKFTPGGGIVTTSIELKNSRIDLAVADNGVGMSEQDALRVGTPFQQADSARHSDARGTGLGLSLVKALAELHDGKFELQTELGQGTRISLDLPIVDAIRVNQAQVQKLDVRSHIRRAQAATEQIAAVSARIAK
jgi:cell cycle sensor histidine kinase DivJ